MPVSATVNAKRRTPKPRLGVPRRFGKVLGPLIVLVVFLTLWQTQVFHDLFGLQTFAVPLPDEIVDSLSYDRSVLWTRSQETFLPALLGFGLGNLVGFALAALLIALPGPLARLVASGGGAIQALPIVAVAALVSFWVSGGTWFKAVSIAIIVFPSMLVYAYRGLTSVEHSALELMSSYRASEWQVFATLRAPSALPHLFTQVKYSTVVTLITVVICEVFRTGDGLGYEIQSSIVAFETPRAWAAVAVLSFTGIAVYTLIEVVERVFFPWAARRDTP